MTAMLDADHLSMSASEAVKVDIRAVEHGRGFILSGALKRTATEIYHFVIVYRG